jgi:guanine nucleotide-binding protein subunit alpha
LPIALFAPAGDVFADLCHIRKTGTGDSGKSTVLKQLKLINGGGYSDEERTFFKGVIFTNIVQSMQAVLEAMDVFGIPFASPATANPHASLIFSQRQKIAAQELSPDVHRAIRTLWDDAGVRACFSRCSEFQVCDSAQ